jgi:hypothetical protein
MNLRKAGHALIDSKYSKETLKIVPIAIRYIASEMRALGKEFILKTINR